MKMIGVGSICAWHSSEHETETQLCRFPEARLGTCHQCGRIYDAKDYPEELRGGVGYCSTECNTEWKAEHPYYAIWNPAACGFAQRAKIHRWLH